MVIFGVCAYLFEFKEGENFNRINILNISRIAQKLHCVPKFEADAEIGHKVPFCKGLNKLHWSLKLTRWLTKTKLIPAITMIIKVKFFVS